MFTWISFHAHLRILVMTVNYETRTPKLELEVPIAAFTKEQLGPDNFMLPFNQ